jgi:hypothetical protein
VHAHVFGEIGPASGLDLADRELHDYVARAADWSVVVVVGAAAH